MTRGNLLTRALCASALVGAALTLLVSARTGAQRAALGRVLAREADDTLEAFVAEGPEVDAGLQDAFLEWIGEVDGFPGGWSASKDDTWYLRGEARPPDALFHEHEALRPTMRRFSTFLADDRLVVTSRGWLRAATRGRDRLPVRTRGPEWTKLRAALRWYGLEAMCAATPAEALRDLDRLWAAMQPVGTFTDLFVAMGSRDVRDRAYVRLAVRGHAGPRLAAWLQERAPAWERLAQAYRADRLLIFRPLARDLQAGRLDAARRRISRSGTVLEQVRDELYLRWGAARDAAFRLEALRRCEAHARGALPAAVLADVDGWREDAGPLFDCTYGDVHRRMPVGLVRERAGHRMARLLVLALACGRERGGLPETDAAFRIWLGPRSALLDGDARDLPLVYERATPDRARIALCAEGELPDFVTAADRLRLREETLLGAGPGPAPLRLEVGGAEAQVPSN